MAADEIPFCIVRFAAITQDNATAPSVGEIRIRPRVHNATAKKGRDRFAWREMIDVHTQMNKSLLLLFLVAHNTIGDAIT